MPLFRKVTKCLWSSLIHLSWTFFKCTLLSPLSVAKFLQVSSVWVSRRWSWRRKFNQNSFTNIIFDDTLYFFQQKRTRHRQFSKYAAPLYDTKAARCTYVVTSSEDMVWAWSCFYLLFFYIGTVSLLSAHCYWQQLQHIALCFIVNPEHPYTV